MRLNIRRLLTSRTTVVSLMFFLLLAIVLSYVIPQRFSTPDVEFFKWQQAHRALLPVVDFLGLHRLFTAPWFAGLLSIFWVSLAFAAYEQFRFALKRTFGLDVVKPPTLSRGDASREAQESFELGLSESALRGGMRRAGYLRVAEITGSVRYVKHPWGYWGIFFLHLGIIVAIAASLFIAVTEKRGALRLAEGDLHLPGSPWLIEERGMFAGPFLLPEAIRLDRVSPEFWEPGGLKNLRSDVSFIAPDGQTTRQTITLESILNYQGLRIYQEAGFGNIFYLLFTDRAGESGEVALDIASPFERGTASYGNFDFAEIPYHIKAKYYADAGKKTLVSDNPLLVLRLIDHDTVIGELSLQKGGNGRLGPYQVRLVRVVRWAGFVFLDTPGMPWVFLGFSIFVLGVVLNYFTIPREFNVQPATSGCQLTWNAARYRRLYMAECSRVVEQLREQVGS